MDEFNYAGNSQIYINRCGACFGFWFDGGELEKLKVYLSPSPLIDAMGRAIVLEQKDFARINENLASIPAQIKMGLVPFLVNMISIFLNNLSGDLSGRTGEDGHHLGL